MQFVWLGGLSCIGEQIGSTPTKNGQYVNFLSAEAVNTNPIIKGYLVILLGLIYKLEAPLEGSLPLFSASPQPEIKIINDNIPDHISMNQATLKPSAQVLRCSQC